MSKRRQRRIGLIHPRLAMTIALLPASAGLMGVWALLTVEHLADDFPALFFGVLFAVPTLTFYWGSVLIWSPSIYWTPDKRNVVAISSMALVVALILAAATVGDANGPQSFILPCLVAGVGSGVAVGVTFTKLYTAPRAPQPDPIPCPACGANLRGQRECRCGKCGKQFTLGELAAAHAVATALGLPVDVAADEKAIESGASEKPVDVSR